MNEIELLIKRDLENILKSRFNIDEGVVSIEIQIPKESKFGDYSTNIAMKLAKILKNNPLNIAKNIEAYLRSSNYIEKIEVVSPGFINLFIKKTLISNIISKILNENDRYGSSNFGNNEKVMVEYVSANPTGDLHLGHARGAAYGDSLTRILSFLGYDVLREYYVNDAGNQIEVLGNSLFERYKEALNEPFDINKIGYQGKDVVKLAQDIANREGNKYLYVNEEDRKKYFKKIGTELELNKIKKDLDLYRVGFDHFQSELDLYSEHKVENTLKLLKESGFTYEFEGALWLKTTDFGDDKDRVLIKKDGSFTYLLPDLAYHKDKFDRGFNSLINLFGADHHGYIVRLKAVLKILGYDPDKLEIKIIQIVRLMENGEEVKMSKRTGNAVTIKELCEDVGVDVARYFFISKPIVSHLDFDLNLARNHSSENPVYYIQYAFARTCSILKKFTINEIKDEYNLLNNKKEVLLIKELGNFNNILLDIEKSKEVNILSNYAYKISSILHSYYNETKIIDENNLELTKQRIALIKAFNITLKNVLNLLGIEAKEVM